MPEPEFSLLVVCACAVKIWLKCCKDYQGLQSQINKTTNIIGKTSQFKTVCKDESGYITQLKQQKSKRCQTEL